jgi:hypothetical protein
MMLFFEWFEGEVIGLYMFPKMMRSYGLKLNYRQYSRFTTNYINYPNSRGGAPERHSFCFRKNI